MAQATAGQWFMIYSIASCSNNCVYFRLTKITKMVSKSAQNEQSKIVLYDLLLSTHTHFKNTFIVE